MAKVRIGVAIMVHNMHELLKACINSTKWADGTYILDDHSDVSAEELIRNACSNTLVFEKSPFEELAFREGEAKVRNYVIQRAFRTLDIDALVLLDADELLTEATREVIELAYISGIYDSVAFSIWHLYTQNHYIHFWETTRNGVQLLDPHIRVLFTAKQFQNRNPDGSHPGLQFTERTLCVHGPHHLHLRYFGNFKLPNYSLPFLSINPTPEEVSSFLQPLPFELPDYICSIIEEVSMPQRSDLRLSHYTRDDSNAPFDKKLLQHPRDRG